jgi:hypothetical protein
MADMFFARFGGIISIAATGIIFVGFTMKQLRDHATALYDARCEDPFESSPSQRLSSYLRRLQSWVAGEVCALIAATAFAFAFWVATM